MRHATHAIALLLIIVAACQEQPGSVVLDPDATQHVYLPRYLPIGTKVPVGQDLLAPPEPFDPTRHTSVPTATPPDANLINRLGFVPPPRPRDHRGEHRSRFQSYDSSPSPGNTDQAITISQVTAAWYGVAAMHDISLNVELPEANQTQYLYAPTLLPPGGSCIELTNVYRKLPDGSGTEAMFALWDWCGAITWAWLEYIDTYYFAQRYVRTYNGRPTIAVSIVSPTGGATDDCWYAHLYDYIAGGWVQKLEVCGTTTIGHASGWTAWESYFAPATPCPVIPGLRAMDIVVFDPRDSQAKPFTAFPADYGRTTIDWYGCWSSSFYTFAFPAPGLAPNSWGASTPSP